MSLNTDSYSKKRGPERANKTRKQILSIAENQFSCLGFAATRLEDIAEELEMTRAGLFYYFSDKQALYDAVIAEAFKPLSTQLERLVLDDSISITHRLESAVEIWVDCVVSRPSLARLIMRFVADGIDQPARRIFVGKEHIPSKFFYLFEQGKKSGELTPLHDDPFHAASAILGTTVFYVAAISALLPNQFEPLDPAQTQSHRHEALHSARRLLGVESELH